jgi:hypothetical protein
MDVQGKITFLDRKLEHDRMTVRASLLWMVAIVVVALFGGFLIKLAVTQLRQQEAVSVGSSGRARHLPAETDQGILRAQAEHYRDRVATGAVQPTHPGAGRGADDHAR